MRRPQTTRKILDDILLATHFTLTDLAGVGPGYERVEKSAERAVEWARRMLAWKAREDDTGE